MIYLYYIALPGANTPASVYDQLLCLFDKDLQQYLSKKRNKNVQARSILAYAMLHKASMHLWNNSAPLSINFGTHGKPSLLGVPHWHIGISHSGDYIAVALSPKPIGIDIERIGSKQYMPIAQRFFSAQEVDYLQNLPIEKQRASFYQLWTLKESYVKALGKGLKISLSSFAFEQQMDNQWQLHTPAQEDTAAKAWHFQCLNILPNYSTAICGQTKHTPQTKAYTIQELLS